MAAKLLKVEDKKEEVEGKEKRERQEKARVSNRRVGKGVRRLTNGHKAQDHHQGLEETNELITRDDEEGWQWVKYRAKAGGEEEYFDISRMSTEQRCFMLRHFV